MHSGGSGEGISIRSAAPFAPQPSHVGFGEGETPREASARRKFCFLAILKSLKLALDLCSLLSKLQKSTEKLLKKLKENE